MKKKIILSLIIIFFITSCSSPNTAKRDNINEYINLLNKVLEQDNFKNSSDLFNLNVEIVQENDQELYYLIIDEAQIEMNDLKALAIVDNKDYDYTVNMAANIGVFEDRNYKMIPSQINIEEDYIRGLVLSGEMHHEDQKLKLVVNYKNSTNEDKYEYVLVDLKRGSVNE